MEQKCPQCGAPLPSGVLAGLCPACLFKQGAAADTAVPEAAAFQPPGVADVAAMFPQLEIIAFIGKGGMGAVYKARQPALDRIVALKILPSQTAAGPGFIERFNREARALAKLNHPNIVAVYEFGQVNALPYFIMEYVDGLNLRMLELAGKLSPQEALQIVPQICDALQFAHDEGIVHRDIKPENILVDKKGRVKIADFGIAKILGVTSEVDLTQTKGAIGTPHYMAPEQMEKPTTVDHRADIFSLGVVFYEMLTGELPLGKFAPPSSRKIEVDVRLDDVVLRALEMDPELRYQHASQVKTAVDTIIGTAAPPPQSAANAAAMAREILARDYQLNIRSCLRRSWKLLKGEFWPFVGITALVLALVGFASTIGGASVQHGPMGHDSTEISSGVAMLVWGPLMGGLFFYFLKKIRFEPTTVETAFCGFTHRFLHLFLAGFVSGLLIGIGFFCLVLPGIYLAVAWMFTLPLVIDKGLDFWSAMELSRKVVTKHWFKLFGFALLLALLSFVSVLALLIGVLVVSPLVFGALMYAYEDIFGGANGTAPALAGTGPSGTVVTPPVPPRSPSAGAGIWTPVTLLGLAVVILAIGFFLIGSLIHHRHHQAWIPPQDSSGTVSAPAPAPVETVVAVEPATVIPPPAFGAETERDLTNFTAINLLSGQTTAFPDSVISLSRGPDRDTAACAWLEQQGLDMAFVDDYDGFYAMTRDLVTLKREDWGEATPDSVTASLRESDQDVAAKFGDSSRLNNPTNYTYGFKTRDGSIGLLEVVGYAENASGVKIRYKLLPPSNTNAATLTTGARDGIRQRLSERLDAASSMNDANAKDGPLSAVAMDAAKAGEVEIASNALAQRYSVRNRDSAAHRTALELARQNLGKAAVEIAKGINDFRIRDQTLSELAK